MVQTNFTTRELQATVEQWINRSFNFINLQNVEKVLENQLFDYIEPNQTEAIANAFLLDYKHMKEYEKVKDEYSNALDYVQEQFEDEFQDYTETDNYPMWNTLFEFREKPSEKVLEAAIRAGLGVICESDYYNAMLFVRGAGYSFYSAHWIPMYLELPWVDASKFKDIDYSHV
jgi:hypothetical protein